MTYSDFEKLCLRHIDQYSVAGTAIPDTYNNQVDTRQRIVELCNIALQTIAEAGEKVTAVIDPDNYDGKTDLDNGWTQIDMPQDFYAISAGLPKFTASCIGNVDKYEVVMHYRYVNQNTILVPTKEISSVLIEYYKYPHKVQGNADETLDCSEAAAACASYYVASQLVREESPYLYQALNNEFESMMYRLKKPMATEYTDTEDVYGF